MDPVASPCNSVCELSPQTGFCLGCWRTLDEIAGWGTFSEAEKLTVLQRIAERRQHESGAASE